MVAASLSVGLVTWIAISPRDKASPEPVTTVAPTSNPQRSVVDQQSPAEPEQLDSERQLSGLYEQFSSFREATGTWPAGTVGDASLPATGRFSWLAVLAAQNDPDGPQPQWGRAWNDSANDRFVRQRQDRFLNPAVPHQTGNDGYPASHFVGVTGVGPDAASLPVGHPRAGMFGRDRVTTLDNVSDGLGNTMLVAGVESDIGSWAAAGRSTMRSFTAEPYVQGPDGFGTGQADGMFVLMADGSTRFLSSKTDPIVLRRMAAAANGLPLDAMVAGEPEIAEATPPDIPDEADPLVEDVEDIVAELAEPVDQPLDVPFVEDGPSIDLAAALAQPIAQFEQKKPIATRQLLLIIEEMVGVEIVETPLPKAVRARLDQPVILLLKDTTVGDLLTAVLQEVRLSYVVSKDQLELIEQTVGIE